MVVVVEECMPRKKTSAMAVLLCIWYVIVCLTILFCSYGGGANDDSAHGSDTKKRKFFAIER